MGREGKRGEGRGASGQEGRSEPIPHHSVPSLEEFFVTQCLYLTSVPLRASAAASGSGDTPAFRSRVRWFARQTKWVAHHIRNQREAGCEVRPHRRRHGHARARARPSRCRGCTPQSNCTGSLALVLALEPARRGGDDGIPPVRGPLLCRGHAAAVSAPPAMRNRRRTLGTSVAPDAAVVCRPSATAAQKCRKGERREAVLCCAVIRGRHRRR